jgi:HEPN domain-containing protein
MAAKSLSLAEGEISAARWREAALFARAAVEHAVKAVAAAFGPVPRSHEPGKILDASLADPRFPDCMREDAAALRPSLDAYGMAEHVTLSYGDEQALVDPWTLVSEAHALESVRVARRAVGFADASLRAMAPRPAG